MQARFGPPILTTGQRNGQSFAKMADDRAQEDSDGQGHNSFMVCHARRGLEPLQFNWFRAAVRLYNASAQSNSSTANKILHATELTVQ